MNYADLIRMPEYLALLRSILERPDDDAPRLIISDFIEENGHELWAKYIRDCIQNERSSIVSLPGKTINFSFHDVVGFCLQSSDVGAVVVGEQITGVWWICGRGFVSEVQLTCAAFMGDHCARCQGSGMSDREYHGVTDDDGGCVKCSGTGRTEGLARELFSRHPITRVTLTDKRPSAVYHNRMIGYRFYTAGQNLPDGLPFEFTEVCRGSLPNLRHATIEKALETLSDACVAYGRKLAGLPVLSKSQKPLKQRANR